MNVMPTATESATNHDNHGRADLAQNDPLVQPNNAPPRNTLQQHPSTGHTSGEGVNLPFWGTSAPEQVDAVKNIQKKASTYPARGTSTQNVEASLSSPWCQTRMKLEQPPPTSPGRGPHFQDPRDPPATGKGGSATPGPVIPPDPPLPRNRSARGRAKGPAKHAGPTAEPMTTGVLSNTAIRQIWALALGERRRPAIRTETAARAAQTALVHEIFSTLRSALVRRVGNPPGP